MSENGEASARRSLERAANDDRPPPADRPPRASRPTTVQRDWLRLGLDQPGGKLPLFYDDGREVNRKTVEACVRKGWAEPWIANPVKPDWLICKLTDAGRTALAKRRK